MAGRRTRTAASMREAVARSLMTLKALTYRPTGGIVAAVTTSLPERIGGTRNWDYRYCWLRDTAFTLLVLLRAGYRDEAVAWRRWLLRAVAGAPDQVQTIYGISGERDLIEWEAAWLPGYERSRPVRIGNGAAEQFQLDVFGEVASALARMPEAEDDIRVSATDGADCAGESSVRGVAAAGRGDLGGARRAETLCPLEGDGVGGAGSGDRVCREQARGKGDRGEARNGRAMWSDGRRCERRFIARFAQRDSTRSSTALCSPTARRRWMHRACGLRWWDFCRLRTRAFAARWRRLRSG